MSKRKTKYMGDPSTPPKFILAERGKQYLPGRVVSDEIDSENARRGGFGVSDLMGQDVLPANLDAARAAEMDPIRAFHDAHKDDPTEDLFKKLKTRNRTEKLDLPNDVDVEKTLMSDGGTYKLGTGPHHLTKVNLRDVKPAKNLRTDIAMDQELAERIARGNTDATYNLYTKTAMDRLKVWIPDGVLFKIQNVRDYFMQHADEHGWYDPESMFAVRLPYDRVLFSYDHDFKNPMTGQMYRRHVNVVMEKATIADAAKAIATALLSDDDARQLLHVLDRRQPDFLIKTYVAIDGFNYPGIWYVMVDETGHVLTDLVHGLHWLWIRDPRETAQISQVERLSGEPMQDAFARHGMICLTAVQFLNCRNVEVVDNAPTRQQRRHAERQGQKPPVTYKTLVIHPMGQKRVKTHNADGTVVHGVPLHIVRGHFKSYMSGAGLGRGHVHGVYWWSPQVRGNAERGRVEKDYEVEQP